MTRLQLIREAHEQGAANIGAALIATWRGNRPLPVSLMLLSLFSWAWTAAGGGIMGILIGALVR